MQGAGNWVPGHNAGPGRSTYGPRGVGRAQPAGGEQAKTTRMAAASLRPWSGWGRLNKVRPFKLPRQPVTPILSQGQGPPQTPGPAPCPHAALEPHQSSQGCLPAPRLGVSATVSVIPCSEQGGLCLQHPEGPGGTGAQGGDDVRGQVARGSLWTPLWEVERGTYPGQIKVEGPRRGCPWLPLQLWGRALHGA